MPMGPKYIVSRKFCGKTRNYEIYLYQIRVYIEIGSNVCEFSESGEKIFIGQITQRAIVYIFINIMMQTMETLGNVHNSFHLFIDDINRWIDDGEPLKIKITDRIKQDDLIYCGLNSKVLYFMANDIEELIKGNLVSFSSDDYFVNFFDHKDIEIVNERHGQFIIDFLKSPQSLFYL